MTYDFILSWVISTLVLYLGGREFKSFGDHFFFQFKIGFSGTFRNKGLNFSFYMIQAQKHQNLSKLHLKLQKEPKLYMLDTRQIFFRILKILKMGVEQKINQSA
jgi:hypothetical protein